MEVGLWLAWVMLIGSTVWCLWSVARWIVQNREHADDPQRETDEGGSYDQGD